MTEAEWRGCNDPEQMLRFYHKKAATCKLLLFAVACCHNQAVWRLVNEQNGTAVKAVEQFADCGEN